MLSFSQVIPSTSQRVASCQHKFAVSEQNSSIILCCTAAAQNPHYGKEAEVPHKHRRSRQARPPRLRREDLPGASIQALQTAAEAL